MSAKSELKYDRRWAAMRFFLSVTVLIFLGCVATGYLNRLFGEDFLVLLVLFVFPLLGLGWFRVIQWLRITSHLGEEWFRQKPVLIASSTGLLYENGSEQHDVPWQDVYKVAVYRKTPLWRTHGNFGYLSPYWLAVGLNLPDGSTELHVRTWEVKGGLMELRRFAKTMEMFRNTSVGSEIERRLPMEAKGD